MGPTSASTSMPLCRWRSVSACAAVHRRFMTCARSAPPKALLGSGAPQASDSTLRLIALL